MEMAGKRKLLKRFESRREISIARHGNKAMKMINRDGPTPGPSGVLRY